MSDETTATRTASASPTTSTGCGRRTGWPTSAARTSRPTGRRGSAPSAGSRRWPTTRAWSYAAGELAYAVLNLYPYAPGHLMVCPYRHVADYTETTDAEAAEIADLTRQAMRVVRSVSGAAGFNIGMNQGHIAGAGIAAHLHQHVVPRWPGDQNFMPIIGRTKTLPELLAETRRLFADAWADHTP